MPPRRPDATRCACNRWRRQSKATPRGCGENSRVTLRSDYVKRRARRARKEIKHDGELRMRLATGRIVCVSALVCSVMFTVRAQEKTAPASKPDPRVGLKAGLRDAGEAARNLERIASLGKPEGFFDPKAPAGGQIPPERDPNLPPLPPPDPTLPPDPKIMGILAFANSDLAFSGT